MPFARLGIDIGSTTIKLALMGADGKLLYSSYSRHKSNVRGELLSCLKALDDSFPGLCAVTAVTGSGGLSIASALGITFVQEVLAGTRAVTETMPEADVIIELGGEDAKLTYLKPTVEQRMNGTCAGGTGSFIDQMAQLLKTDADGLNDLAAKSTTIYQIASRCGVFAKSDLQPLLNEGAAREDLAASVLQAVVNQTIAGLAQGRTISGNVVFLGGPLSFMPELRRTFEKTLAGTATSFTVPENAKMYVAIGAAILAEGEETNISELISRIESGEGSGHEIQRMRPLFENEAEREAFYRRHSAHKAQRGELEKTEGPLFLGIDAGSTTIKTVVCDKSGTILYTYYAGNASDPVGLFVGILGEIYEKLPETAYIASACVTGYGEALLKAALKADHGEIETVAHFTAARHFSPNADFVIDIGGQDMKCMSIKDGIIQNIMLNEACSSGCGSFIETFALSLSMDAESFSNEALTAKNPVDLGTRCTVFMNSRVKQAQKEGATVGDISAGLCYSVVRNALYKVIRLRDPAMLGQNVVVQGGTFNNNAILRAFELISGCSVIRPDIAGLMGAFGSALIARNRWIAAGEKGKSTLIDLEGLKNFKAESRSAVCQRCQNHCRLTITRFSSGSRFISGNRCERGGEGGDSSDKKKLPNLFAYKYDRVFDYTPIDPETAPLGSIGLPRALNMYENYPFWFTFLSELGFSVQISSRSDHDIFKLGMDTIPSESVCYPAKLVHGHIINLLERGIRTIFYPSIPYEQTEFPSDNHYNCPIVTSYPEVIANNIDRLREDGVSFLHPFVALSEPKSVKEQLYKTFEHFGVTKKQVSSAVDAAYEEQARCREDIRAEGRKTLEFIKRENIPGVVLAGRPYHIDPEIHHGIPEMINGLGMAVLTEDSVAPLGKLPRPIRVVDQWAYHTRLYEAAALVCRTEGLYLVQLNSFGCGLDAVTTDQVSEILQKAGRMYTLLKIDEISNLGAARIRMRSLRAAIDERSGLPSAGTRPPKPFEKVIFTPEMRKKHTILGPQMSPFHFEFLETAFNASGYNFRILDKVKPDDVETGLKFVHNDACYPSILVVGQLVNAFVSGRYDPDNTSVIITQTGGGCRATNYIAFLRAGLQNAGFGQVPVISLNMSGLDKQPGFKYSPKLVVKMVKAVVFGDLFLNTVLRMRPYEAVPGSTDALHKKWANIMHAYLRGEKGMSYRQIIAEAVAEFDALPIREGLKKPRVGLVGEILVKFHPDANNDAIGVVEREGGEAVMPGLMDFILYFLYNANFKHENLGAEAKVKLAANATIAALERYRAPLRRALEKSVHFHPPKKISEIAEGASKILSLGNSTGEGWFLTGEMVELIESGVPNIICMQPFACLPNHVTGKGMIKELRRRYPQANIVPVDYDPGASEVNQLNRIKLMLSTAINNLDRKSPMPADGHSPAVSEKDQLPAPSLGL